MLFRILAYAKPYRWRVAVIAVLISVMAGLNQAEPLITRSVTDALVSDQRTELGQFFFILIIGLLVVKFVQTSLNRLTWQLTNVFAINFESHLKQKGFDHLMSLSMSFFNEQSTGKMMSKLDRGVNRIVNIVNNSGMHFLPSFTTAVISLAFVLRHDWRIGVTIIAAFVPYILINRWRFQRNSKLERREYKLYDRQYSHFWEVLSSMSLVKAFRAENFERQRLKKFFKQIVGIRSEMEHNTNLAMVGDLFLETWNWGMFAFIAWQAWQNTITLGTMFFLLLLVRLIREPLWQLNWIFWEVKRAQIGARDFFAIMDLKPEVSDPESPQTIEKVRGEIEFDQVSFVYHNASVLPDHDSEPEEKPKKISKPQVVFENASFRIEAGKTTAFVGPSGAGKTTIAALVMRFFDPTSGKISLDGIDLRDLRQRDLRQHVGLVSQDAYLFADTIAENLRYAKPDAMDKEMWSALEAAYAAEFIRVLPQGLETEIGDRGVKLSGGQRQRLSLARTILRNPEIIILDEATSALDSESELYIQRALAKLLKDRTAIVIAHRLSTIQRADNIIVLKDKSVLEQGSHKELLKKDGLYASLFKIQSGDVETLKEWELVP